MSLMKKRIKETMAKPLIGTSLQDMVKGLRSNAGNEQAFINQTIADIKKDIVTSDMKRKAICIQKLTYLEMLGQETNWSGFHIIELSAKQSFWMKRVAYLAAQICLHESDDVLMLITNQLKKDLQGTAYESCNACACFSAIVNESLARDLAAELVKLLTSGKDFLRRRACLMMYPMCKEYPDALRPSFAKMKEKLKDSDPTVVAAACVSFVELVKHEPKQYISLAPILYEIIKEPINQNNDLLMTKAIKILGMLASVELRLAKILVEPFNSLLQSNITSPILFELINACIIGLNKHIPTMKTCLGKINMMIQDNEGNIRYCGLKLLGLMMTKHPKAVIESRDTVLACLSDPDDSLRRTALELLIGMVTKKNICETVDKLLVIVEKSENSYYRDELFLKIIEIIKKDNYDNVTDFEWYLKLLSRLSTQQLEQSVFNVVSKEISNIMVRVPDIRLFGITLLKTIITSHNFLQMASGSNLLVECAWCVGEYIYYLTSEETLQMLRHLINVKHTSLNPDVQASFLEAAFKTFIEVVDPRDPADIEEADDDDEVISIPKTKLSDDDLTNLLAEIDSTLTPFAQSTHLEVQERACFMLAIVRQFESLREQGIDVIDELRYLNDEILLPVNPKAQSLIEVPEDLHLDDVINPEFEEAGKEDTPDAYLFDELSGDKNVKVTKSKSERKGNAFYIDDDYDDDLFEKDDDEPKETVKVEMKPVEMDTFSNGAEGLTAEEELRKAFTLSKKKGTKKGSSKGKKGKVTGEVMPEVINKKEKIEEKDKEKDKLAQIDLAAPVSEKELLALPKHRSQKTTVVEVAQQNLPRMEGGKDLCKNKAFGVKYLLKTNKKHPTKVMIQLEIENFCEFKASVAVLINQSTLYTIDSISRTTPIPTGGYIFVTIIADLKKINSVVLKGAIKCAAAQTTSNIAIKIPASTFIIGTELSKPELAQIIKTKKMISMAYSVSEDTKFDVVGLFESLQLLAVKGSANKIWYGITLKGDDIAILLTNKQGKIGFDVKTTDKICGDAILKQIKETLGQQ
ncbi:Adapter-related protein complex 3 (AP-3) subunit, putative [Entamoeba histolytica HM-1:IMSS]|uniref:AP-3 complex subunit delta n=1 Tax=Entamoeba histolytica (strain ATCC 30459 / HM-1:IMSS / ABRM) TaxID=294381 RepID=C4M1X4_ENTH1|nr:Adapter-related protein complex 3 (AP-3) subunit, putative [Entamoeba histolytica HM-1:IMSS]EAL49830.2 Adapter-related protein complex 3 (AP-3) subunit, putative [Entamoeba histolytica HM-1:IMSS]|eukprot:XP_655217.2 Adapter-related protein complex 3 (AP-3) subunit, putative [Entamoeba histolytica HM-1:IMSS]